ncbi:MAG: 5'-nucleotidase, lipoprotein e(P4) family [Thermoanaerobaculia bacterium]|nr:5'-nucleotidase, lipoprotein e(P4) family [Thermoanaerobaculia bacterium]
MRTAVEYQASARQAYAAAQRALDLALADPAWSAVTELTAVASGERRPAIILDLDETCLDNSAYQARLTELAAAHTEEAFEEHIRSGNVTAVPGTVEFLHYAESRGVTIFYVTNQRKKIEEASRANLRRLGLPLPESEDTVLTLGEMPDWVSDKSSRRAFVAQKYRVLLLVGDDFNDFVSANGKSLAERKAIFDRHADWFGTKWIILPNPTYGSWERAALGGAGSSAEDRFKARMRAIQSTAGH